MADRNVFLGLHGNLSAGKYTFLEGRQGESRGKSSKRGGGSVMIRGGKKHRDSGTN